MQAQSIDVDGGRASYVAASGGEGRGQIFVFVHDVGECGWMWRRQLERLGAGHSAYAIDLPGHGDSADAMALASTADCAGFLARFIDAVARGPVVLIGKGFGASIALHYAAANTRRVRGLVLIGAAAQPELPAAMLPGWAAAVRDRALPPYGEEQFSPATPEVIRQEVECEQAKASAAVRYRDVVAWTSDDFRSRLSDIRQPVLVIAGADDRVVPAETSQDLCPQLPNARLEVIEEAGHAVEREQACAVTAKIESFVGSLHHEH